MARRTLTRRDAVGAALAAGSMLLAGCAGKGSSPAVKQVQPEEVEPVEPAKPIEQTAEPDPADWTQVELDPAPTLSWTVGTSDNSVTPNDWHWEDGVLATSVAAVMDARADEAGQVSFASFDPVSGLSFSFAGAVAQANEEIIEEPFVTSTYGAERAAWLVYRVRQEADGLDPESTHIYAQRLDYASGGLGDRVELPDGDLHGSFGTSYRLASSATRVGVYVENDAGTSVISLASDGTVETVQTGGFSLLTSFAAGAYAHTKLDEREGRDQLRSLDDGSVLLESRRVDDYEDTPNMSSYTYMVDEAMRLSDGVFLTGAGDLDTITYYVQGSEPVALADQIMALMPEDSTRGYTNAQFMGQLLDGSVILSIMRSVIRVSAGPTIECLLERERFDALEAVVMGADAVTGDIYLQTTDENVIMSPAGEDAGRWSLYPVSAHASSYGSVYTTNDTSQTKAVLWLERNDDDEVTRAVVTRGGQPT